MRKKLKIVSVGQDVEVSYTTSKFQSSVSATFKLNLQKNYWVA